MVINFDQFRKDTKVVKIADGITGYVSWFENCCTYFIEGDKNVLIDASYPLMKPLSDEHIDIIALTHVHCDHSTIAKELAEAHKCEVYASIGTVQWLKKYGNEIIPANRTDVKEKLSRYKQPPEVYPPKITRIIKEGDVIRAGSFNLRVLETPGHSPGDLCFHEEEKDIIFCGDVLLGGWKVRGGDEKLLEESARRIKSLKVKTLCPGHLH